MDIILPIIIVIVFVYVMANWDPDIDPDEYDKTADDPFLKPLVD